MSSSSFNVGLRFYYWPFYKELQAIPDEEQYDDPHDHSGYEIKQLFVTQKYGSFKKEISNYKYLLFQQYKDEIVMKVNIYNNSDIAKETKANALNCKDLHYGIAETAKLGFQNLVSLILYTDYSDLSTDFSKTFRKKSPYESLQSIKNRNSEYFWMSKILRETVEIFGGSSYQDDGYESDNILLGPYYCGMKVVMNMPSFSIRLCSPTSTSGTLEVAIKFSGEDGIIIQLDNPNVKPYRFITGFDCSWLSRYKEENERYTF